MVILHIYSDEQVAANEILNSNPIILGITEFPIIM